MRGHLANEDGKKQLFLVLEVVIRRALGHPCCFGQLLHGDVGVAMLRGMLPANVEQRVASRMPVSDCLAIAIDCSRTSNRTTQTRIPETVSMRDDY